MHKKKIIAVALSILILILTGIIVFQNFRHNKMVAINTTKIPVMTKNVPDTVFDNKKIAESYTKQGEPIPESKQQLQGNQISESKQTEVPNSENNNEDTMESIREKVRQSKRFKEMEGKSEEEKKVLKHEAMLNTVQQANKKAYAIFFERNNISSEDIENVTKLLAKMDFPELAGSIKSIKDIQTVKAECMNNIKSILGEGKYKEFTEYKDSLPERNTVNNFNNSLPTDNKLKNDQIEPLINAIYNAQIKFDSMDHDDSELPSQNDPYIDASKGILTEQQVVFFEDYLEESNSEAQDMAFTLQENWAKENENKFHDNSGDRVQQRVLN